VSGISEFVSARQAGGWGNCEGFVLCVFLLICVFRCFVIVSCVLLCFVCMFCVCWVMFVCSCCFFHCVFVDVCACLVFLLLFLCSGREMVFGFCGFLVDCVISCGERAGP